MKTQIKIYLEDKDIELLKEKSEQAGFKGKGSLSHYLSYLANSSLLIVDSVSLKNLIAQNKRK